MQAITSAHPAACPGLSRLPQQRAQQPRLIVPKVRMLICSRAPMHGGWEPPLHICRRRFRTPRPFLQATSSDVQQWLSQGLITDQEAKK